MTKTQEALRIELEELKNEVYEMRSMYDKKLSIESNRVDRIVQVLLNNLPKEQLDRGITFSGFDCCDKYRS